MTGPAIPNNFREGPAPGQVSSYDVEGDLSTLQYTFVEMDTSRARCVKAYSSGFPTGVLVNRPVKTATATAFSLIAMVQTAGKALITAGSGGIALGDLVKVTTGGKVIKATPADKDLIVGQCEFAAAENAVGTIRLFTTYVSMT